MGKEKEFRRCLIRIVYAPISDDEKVKLVRILDKKGPYCLMVTRKDISV